MHGTGADEEAEFDTFCAAEEADGEAEFDAFFAAEAVASAETRGGGRREACARNAPC